MAAAVLLLHQLPDGSSHFDWLIQRPGGPDEPLVSFRVAERIDSGAIGAFSAERLPDHRPLYLAYEGPISGGRGSVRPVASGTLDVLIDLQTAFVVRGWLGAAKGDFSGKLMSDGCWMFGFAAQDNLVG